MRLDFSMMNLPAADHQASEDWAEIDDGIGVFAVADGMGGRPGGAQASKAAVCAFLKHLKASVPAAESALVAAIYSANRAVRALAQSEPSLSGLGTTLSAVAVNGEQARIVHVGDSRVYLFRAGSLQQLTNDHTLVETLVKLGRISRESVGNFPLRNVLSRCIGADENVEPDLVTVNLKVGDWIVLATDGLTKTLVDTQFTTDRENASLMQGLTETAANGLLELFFLKSQSKSPEDVCRAMMQTVVAKPLKDDVTVIVISLLEDHNGAV